MNAHKRGRRGHISHDERDGLFDAPTTVGAELSTKSVDAKVAPAGREIRGCYLLNNVLFHTSIIAATSAESRTSRSWFVRPSREL